jgi:phosphopantothenate-cysteine ligase
VDYLVTAGGTTERIDGVRSITNFATGRLGALIAEGLARQPGAGTVFYVCGKHAVRPHEGTGGPHMIQDCNWAHQSNHVNQINRFNRINRFNQINQIEVEGVSDLEDAIRNVLTEHTVGAIVHSMAVSDYYVDRILDGDGREITVRDKISSSERELRLILKPAKKIIGMLRGLSPEAVLVGFKLLNNVPEAELTAAAYALLEKNHCDCVLANDLVGISGDKHVAFLVDTRKNITRFETKAQIADGICRFVGNNVKTVR